MKTVKQILDTKGRDFHFVAPETPVYDAMRVMAEKEIGSVLVMEDGKLVGIVTERDYARKVIFEGPTSPESTCAEIMTTEVLYTTPGRPIEDCMALMTEKRVRHLPVLEDGEVRGLVSIGDLVKAVIAEQRFIIEQLERYITG